MLDSRKERDQGGSVGEIAAVKPLLDGLVNPRARLGEMLVQEGVVTNGQLEEALKLQKDQGGFLGNALVSLRYIDQNTLVSFLVKQCKIPHISLLDYNVDDELFRLIPKELCLKHLCIPIDQLGKILTVAMVNPFDADALESVRATCPDLKIKPILCDYNHFDQVARKYLNARESTPEPTDEVSAQSFGLRPSTSSKPSGSARAKKRIPRARIPAKTTTSEGTIASTQPSGAASDPDVLAIQIEAALTAGLNEALAPVLSTIESMQEQITSLSQPVRPATNVEAFPESSVKPNRSKNDDSDVLAASGVVPQGDTCVRSALLESPLCAAYSFDDFFGGSANAVTESLIRSLPDSPDSGISPMYLSGGVGLGKTHLLHAIGNACIEANPDIRVRCMTAGMFIRATESELSSDTIQPFLEGFSKADVFLLDDIHLLADRHAAQAAFIEVFDALNSTGRLVVVTGLEGGAGTRPLNEQLHSRINGSVMASVKPPDFETRIEILRHLVTATKIDDDILTLIAEQVTDDMRRLKGAFAKVSAHVRAVGDNVSTDDAREMIAQFGSGAVA